MYDSHPDLPDHNADKSASPMSGQTKSGSPACKVICFAMKLHKAPYAKAALFLRETGAFGKELR